MRRCTFVALITALAWSGCAARSLHPVRSTIPSEAQSLVDAGCYACLRSALAAIETASVVQMSPPLARAAFTTSVLLTIRGRELGLPEEQWMERARFWSQHMQRGQGQLPASAYFDAIELIRGDTSGLPPPDRERRAIEHRMRWTQDGSVPPARAALSPHLKGDVVAEYIALTLDCEDAQARKTLAPEEVFARHPVPLIRFRLLMCAGNETGLRALFESDPRWVDTLWILGRLAMMRQPSPGLMEAANLLTTAHAAFPTSPSIMLALASVRNALADHTTALELFNSVLKDHPQHHDALFGRLLSQSYLNQHTDAVATATALLELGADHVGPAWYWRAWNYYQLRALDAAWRDVSLSLSIDASASTFALAGMIAYARQWPVTAIDRLRKAYALDPHQCDAAWTEGLVHVDQEDWREAAGRFAIATDCFVRSVEQARRELQVARENLRVHSSAEHAVTVAEGRLETAQRRLAQSAFNAANTSARQGDREAALRYLRISAGHPLTASESEALKRRLLTPQALHRKAPGTGAPVLLIDDFMNARDIHFAAPRQFGDASAFERISTR